MISENKGRIITSLPKELIEKMEKMSKETGVSKSAIVSLAVTSFIGGLKVGEMTFDKIAGGKDE